jgi:flagellin
MRINTNVSALTAAGNLGKTEASVAKSMAKLSSGFRINSASDDAAGLAIANKFRADLRSLTQASRNAEQANSVLQIAEGGASNIEKILERMKELATQSAADAVDTAGRTQIDNEFTALSSEIDRITNTVTFQSDTLLNGSYGSSVTYTTTTTTGIHAVKLNGGAAGNYTLAHGSSIATLTGAGGSQTLGTTAGTQQTLNFSTFGISIDTNNNIGIASLNTAVVTVGAGSGGKFMVSSSGSYGSNDAITLSSLDLRISTMGLTASATIGLETRAKAETTLTALDTAIRRTATALGTIGAAQNRIEFANSNTKTAILNVSAAQSVLRDLDMAEEMTSFSKNQILQQAGTAMLAQANQSGQSILTLLRG